MKGEFGIQNLDTIIQDYGFVHIVGDTLNEYTIICKSESDMLSLAARIYESGMVEYATPDFYGGVEKHSINPTDPKFNFQYYLNNRGQVIPNMISNIEYGSNGLDINVLKSWTFVDDVLGNLGSNIKVAVIDDGVENHEDLMSGSTSRVLSGWTCRGGNGNPMPGSSHYSLGNRWHL